METLYIEGNKTSPTFLLNPQKGLVEITGRSIPENAEKLYLPAIQWVREFFSSDHGPVVFNFKLEYFNSTSARSLINLLTAVKENRKPTDQISFNWYYDEDDIKEYGEDYQDIVNMKFNFMKINY